MEAIRRHISAIIFLFFIAFTITGAQEFTVNSPSKKLTVKIDVSKNITYSVIKGEQIILAPSAISLTLSGNFVLGKEPELAASQKQRMVDEELKPIVKQKREIIRNNYTELYLPFEGNYSVVFRVYDDAVAYRFRTTFPSYITVKAEQAEFNFPQDHEMLFPEEESFMSHSEREYLKIKISEVTPQKFCSLPALLKLENNVKAVITEADLEDYPGMYLKGTEAGKTNLMGLFPAYPKKDTILSDRDVFVTEREDYLAKTNGTRSFPWRVIVVSEKDADLLETEIIYKLAKPADDNMDFSWVKPGKVSWDWWNANNIYGVDFRAGINNETYKYYIDFASKYNIDYIILDEGWYKLGNLLDLAPDINVKELVDYGNAKNVGVILWVSWKTLEDQLEPALNKFEEWGVEGIKVDFMQRDDQWMVNYYYKIAKEAAKRKMLVDFHGAYKPTGLIRTYPNVLTSEGLRGMEQSKWSNISGPEQTTILPFIRMLAGPMDYTPGAMKNGTKNNFRSIWSEPMSMGTRCQQLAMYVIFESPLQMLSDNPTNYYKEPECMDFLSKVPVVWDDTKVLEAKLGEHLITARRNGSNWYIGAMTNWTARDITIDFSFLPEGEYIITIWQDGINADRNANDYKKVKRIINKNEKMNIHLAPGGGWAAMIETKWFAE